MGWARFDDRYSDHPKVVAAGPWAELLDVRAIIFCARHETDGHVGRAQLARIAVGIPAPRAKVAKLVEVGRWSPDARGDGWWVHDYLTYNPSHAKREVERASARDRMERARSQRSSDEQAAKFARGSGNPVPSPTPPEEQNNHLSSSEIFGLSWATEDDVVTPLANRLRA
jgi:hypothetical protein